MSYGLELQAWLRPELINATATARSEVPRELMDRRNQLQLQFLILAESTNS